jgi:hypothetical protein
VKIADRAKRPIFKENQGGFVVHKAQEYREHAHRCELMLEKARDLRVRERLRRERQEWLELAASREAADLGRQLPGERALDEDMTLSALRAFERGLRGHG